MNTPFTIRFDGLCCHANWNGKKRVLLPDASTHADHRIYIEFFAVNYTPQANPNLFPYGYTRQGVRYGRIEFKNCGISLRNVASATLQILPSFDYRVPHLKEVSQDFGDIKRVFMTDPPDPTLGAYFDMPGGVLTTGPAEEYFTFFEDATGHPTSWPKRKVPEWTQLDLELTDDAPVFDITTLGGSPVTTTLVLNSGAAMITIGNQIVADIQGTGDPNSDGHFHVYYDALPEVAPADRPTPKRGLGLGTGCSNTNWP